MTVAGNIKDIILDHKPLFIVIVVILFLLELEIFAVAVMKSGRKSWLQVIDTNGNIIYQTDGDNLSEFNNYYFEKTFGPLAQYEIKLVTKEIPFPFRAWFVAAVGLPVGIVLLLAFIVKAYMTLFYETEKTSHFEPDTVGYETRMEKIIAKISRFNIFTLGFLIFLAVFGYWVIPNFIVYLSHVGIETLVRFKWFFLFAAIIMLAIVGWIIYLRYLLAVKTIETQAEIEKKRLQLEMRNYQLLSQLEYQPKTKE